MEITFRFCRSLWRIFLFCRNYVISLLDLVTFFDDVRITLYFGIYELRMEMTRKLRFVFVRHCDVFFISSQLRAYLFHVVTFFDNVRNRFYFGTLELRKEITLPFFLFLFVIVTYFLLRQNYVTCLFDIVTFLMTLELRYILVRWNYIRKLLYKMVIF